MLRSQRSKLTNSSGVVRSLTALSAALPSSVAVTTNVAPGPVHVHDGADFQDAFPDDEIVPVHAPQTSPAMSFLQEPTGSGDAPPEPQSSQLTSSSVHNHPALASQASAVSPEFQVISGDQQLLISPVPQPSASNEPPRHRSSQSTGASQPVTEPSGGPNVQEIEAFIHQVEDSPEFLNAHERIANRYVDELTEAVTSPDLPPTRENIEKMEAFESLLQILVEMMVHGSGGGSANSEREEVETSETRESNYSGSGEDGTSSAPDAGDQTSADDTGSMVDMPDHIGLLAMGEDETVEAPATSNSGEESTSVPDEGDQASLDDTGSMGDISDHFGLLAMEGNEAVEASATSNSGEAVLWQAQQNLPNPELTLPHDVMQAAEATSLPLDTAPSFQETQPTEEGSVLEAADQTSVEAATPLVSSPIQAEVAEPTLPSANSLPLSLPVVSTEQHTVELDAHMPVDPGVTSSFHPQSAGPGPELDAPTLLPFPSDTVMQSTQDDGSDMLVGSVSGNSRDELKFPPVEQVIPFPTGTVPIQTLTAALSLPNSVSNSLESAVGLPTHHALTVRLEPQQPHPADIFRIRASMAMFLQKRYGVKGPRRHRMELDELRRKESRQKGLQNTRVALKRLSRYRRLEWRHILLEAGAHGRVAATLRPEDCSVRFSRPVGSSQLARKQRAGILRGRGMLSVICGGRPYAPSMATSAARKAAHIVCRSKLLDMSTAAWVASEADPNLVSADDATAADRRPAGNETPPLVSQMHEHVSSAGGQDLLSPLPAPAAVGCASSSSATLQPLMSTPEPLPFNQTVACYLPQQERGTTMPRTISVSLTLALRSLLVYLHQLLGGSTTTEPFKALYFVLHELPGPVGATTPELQAIRAQVNRFGFQRVVSDLWIREVYRTNVSLDPAPFFIDLCDPSPLCPHCRRSVIGNSSIVPSNAMRGPSTPPSSAVVPQQLSGSSGPQIPITPTSVPRSSPAS